MAYALTRNNHGNFEDQDGCTWESPENWLWVGVMGGCGCGSSDDIEDLCWEVLSYFATPHAERGKRGELPTKELDAQIIAHWMDMKGLTNHGGSVHGSWLTDDGRAVYAAMRATRLGSCDDD